MKKLLLLSILSITANAMAITLPATVEPNGDDGYYVSWCDQDQVVQEDANGKTKVLADCRAAGQRCVMTQYMSRRMPVYAGVCEAK